VLYTYNVELAAPGDSRVAVTVAATARNLHGPLYAAIAAQNPRRVRIVYRGVEEVGGDIAIPLETPGSGARAERRRHAVMGGLAAFALIAIGGFTYLFIADQRASAALEATQTELVDVRKKLAARGPQGAGGDREAQTILAKKRATAAAVVALDKLSLALPDDTWLSELQLNNEGQLRVTGTSQNVASLVPQIEAAGIFSDATFFSPTTRLQGGEGDRFHLQMKLRQAQTQSLGPGQRPAGARR
jgi:general secretion pathway protein L